MSTCSRHSTTSTDMLTGDHALAVLGSALRHSSRSFDVAGRVGGDEFAVILPATSLASAAQIAKRMTVVLEHPNGVDINVSIGFATLDRREPASKRLFQTPMPGCTRPRPTDAAAKPRRPTC